MEPNEAIAAHIAALNIVVQDMVEIMHRHHPEAVEAKLRSARLFFQETELGRLPEQDEQAMLAHRLRRDLYERVLARNLEPDD